MFFPTFLCGVLVFVSVSRPLLLPSAPPPVLLRRLRHLLSHTQFCHTPSLSHTTLSHTTLWHTTLSHTTLSHATLSRAWATSTGVSRGRRGTHIHLCFAWQAWHLGHWAGSGVVGHRGTGRSVHVLATVERPALLSTASLRRPAFSRTTVAHATLACTTLLHATFSHTTRSHSYTTIHNFLTHNSCTHNCFILIHHTFLTHTHNSSTYNFFNLSILHHLLCLSFLLCPASTLVSNYWKKLTCGVIRSFNFPIQRQFLAPCFPRIFRIRRLMVIVSTISPAVNLLCNQLRDSKKYRAPYFPMYPYTLYILTTSHIFLCTPWLCWSNSRQLPFWFQVP